MKELKISFAAALLSLAFFTCHPPQHFLEQNRYDDAVRTASNRLDGKRKKTQHVQTLETAFAKANESDLAKTDSLAALGDPANWEAIHAIHLKMLERQKRVEPLLPLVDEEGTRPDIRLLPLREMAAESRQKMLDFKLFEIRQNLELAAQGEKAKARTAWDQVKNLQKKHDWKDPLAQILLDSALEVGRVYILLNLENGGTNYGGNILLTELSETNIKGEKNWQEIHRLRKPGQEYDFSLRVKVTDTWVSFDDKTSSCRSVEKEVQTGQKEEKDTSGKVTITPIFEKVSATIYEVRLEKRAKASADFEALDLKTGAQVLRKEVDVTSLFSTTYSYYSGDSRAVDGGVSISGSDNFPSEASMLRDCAWKLESEIEHYLKKLSFMDK